MSVFNEEAWAEQWHKEAARPKVRCSRCLYDEFTPDIEFDQDGVCNYCKLYEELNTEYPSGEPGRQRLEDIVTIIKESGKNKKYDVIIGVSGGCDSSYMITQALDLGLRPLAVHFDNTWNSTIAVENIHAVLDALSVDLYTHVVDNEEYDDIVGAFFRAGVPDLETPTDIGLAATLYRAAEAHGVKYIFEGHSFRTEGVCPVGWQYMDARYIKDVHNKHGQGIKMKTYPNLWFWDQMKWRALQQIRLFRPLYHLEHNKEDTKKQLTERFGWQWYGGHHLENRLTAFFHSYFMPRRYGINLLINGQAALVRTGQLDRDEGIRLLQVPPTVDPEIVGIFKRRMGLSDSEFDHYLTQPPRYPSDFKTYKKWFETLRPIFWAMYKKDLVPKSFYLKYCCKQKHS